MRKAILAVGLLLSCVSARADEPIVVLTTADEAALRQRIERNWSVPAGTSACDRKIVVRVHIEGDGAVKEVKLLDPQPVPDACQQAAESAKRAVLISSPLPLPKGLNAFTLDMVCDHNKLLE